MATPYHVDASGLLTRRGHRDVLLVDGGGEWDVDLLWRHRRLLGRRVRVQGRRSGFNLLDARTVEPI